MRHRFLIPALSAACYAALGELYFRGDRSVRDAWGHCAEAPADYTPVALGIGAAVFVVSAALFARSLGARWKGPVALQAALALLAGGMLGNVRYGYRMTHGSACAQTEFCTWCTTPWWDRPAVAFILLALIGALLSLPIGLLARRLRGRRSARDEIS
jgi:hypothetical protein